MSASSLRNLELDKICRVCLTDKKDMRPLFGEMVVDMLMECTKVNIENTDGWPDKICVQCVQQVSRFHSFKVRVEKLDLQLRNYIKGLTVIVEEPMPKFAQIELPQQIAPQYLHNGQIQNSHVINTSQLVTPYGQPIQIQPNGQLVQVPIQVLPNGQTQMVEFQRPNDESCEIIVQPESPSGHSDLFEESIYSRLEEEEEEEVDEVEEGEDNQSLIEEIDEDDIVEEEEIEEIHEYHEIEEGEQLMEEDMEQDEHELETEVDQDVETEIEDTGAVEETIPEKQTFSLDLSDNEDQEDKEYIAEFISMQTSCPGPGRYMCNLCRKEFKFAKWLQIHMKSHSNWIKANCKKQPQCEICHKSFRGPGMLKMHMKTHEIRTLQCELCKKSFQSKYHLQTHLVKHNRRSEQGENYECEPCQQSFISANDLRLHGRKYHKGEGRASDQQSPKTSSSSSDFGRSSGSKSINISIQSKDHQIKINRNLSLTVAAST